MATVPAYTDRRPHFFKVLLPGFTERLRIPPAFVKHIECDGMPQKAMILNPLGRIFHVQIEKDMEHLFFGAGWRQFADAHDLDLWYFLMFRYEGHVIFSVRVFDLTGCEKEYATTEGEGTSNRRTQANSSNNIVQGFTRRPITRSCKKNAAEEMRLRRQSYKRRAMGMSRVLLKNTSETTTTREKYPTFKVVITRSNLTSHVYIPLAFKTANHISRIRTQMILKDPRGRLWTVEIHHTSMNRTMLGKGWKELSVANNLKVGDECTFELVPARWRKRRILEVHIQRKD